nr:immunoglobulin light chain junction region [Macaca mulatta]MOW59721.1 immunoglobulin light chain junction region [Macaca mulatta]MOW61430.1 immunoglobulin light chain junction region [Macaca mulatta]
DYYCQSYDNTFWVF